jgi:hypothetical protein
MSRKNSTAVGIGAAISGAAIAAFIGMGTAYADTPDIIPSVPNGSEDLPWQNIDTGGFSELFGGTGSVQGVTDAQDDTTLAAEPNSDAAAFSSNVITFEDGIDHPITDIVYALDPSAFQFQDSPGIDAVGEGFGGAYLVPDDSLGYLATYLDYFLLSPTGLGDLLGPIGEILLGSSF